ncbi:MAG: hypothetical protein ACFFBP_01300 [Promethearchaeota archaeon]
MSVFTDDQIKGLKLERDAHQFLWDHGYLVFPRLKLYAIRYKISQNGERLYESLDKLEVTDLDCYGIIFGKFLEKKTFLIDCKHRSESIFSQILRMKGVATILKIDYLLILRESVSETVQQFADKFDIRLQASSSFQKKIKQNNFGSFSLNVYKIILDLYKNQDSFSKEITSKFSNCFLEIDPFLRIKQLRILYNKIKENQKNSKEKEKITLLNYLFFQIFLYTLVTITEIAGLTIHLSKHHFNGYIEQKLIGNIEFKKKIFIKMREIEGVKNTNEITFNPLKELTPSFTESLKDIVIKFHKGSRFVQLYLRYNDFIIHEYYLKKKKINKDDIKQKLGIVNYQIFGEWNIKCLEILDEEKEFPIFLVELLT